MVSISWKSVQSGTLYVALIPSARVFNSEQAESRIGLIPDDELEQHPAQN